MLQDAVLDDVERALATVVEGIRRPAAADRHRRAAAPPQPHLQLRRRHPPRPRSSASSRSPTCRPTASSTSGGSSPPATASAARSASAAAACRSAPTCCSPPRTCPASSSTPRSARTCGSRSRRAPRRRWRARPCSLNLSGSPITIGRAEDRKLLCRSASSRCLAAYVYAAAGQGESIDRPRLGRPDHDLRERRAAGRDRALPGRRPARGRRRRPRPAAARSGAGWARSTTTGARTPRPERSAACGFTLDPPGGDIGLLRQRRALPVRAGRRRAPRSRLLRGLQHPGRRAAAAAARDRRPEGRDRRLRRARLDAGADRRRAGDGPRGPPAQRHPRLHDARLRDQRRHEGQRASADARRSASPPRSSTSRRPRS